MFFHIFHGNFNARTFQFKFKSKNLIKNFICLVVFLFLGGGWKFFSVYQNTKVTFYIRDFKHFFSVSPPPPSSRNETNLTHISMYMLRA